MPKGFSSITKMSFFLACICLIFAISGCSSDKSPANDAAVPDNGILPKETAKDESPSLYVRVPEKYMPPKTYDNWAEAYLDVLSENKLTITNPYYWQDEMMSQPAWNLR